MRDFLAILAAPILAIAGVRFSKTHRQEETLTYRLINTVQANRFANKLRSNK